MAPQPIPSPELPSNRTVVIILLLMVATVLFFTADLWLRASLLPIAYPLASKIVLVVMWSTLGNLRWKWAGLHGSWLAHGGWAVILLVGFLLLFPAIGIIVALVGAMFLCTLPIYLLYLGAILVIWVGSAAAKKPGSVRWAKRAIITVGLFLLPIYVDGRNMVSEMELVGYSSHDGHQYFTVQEEIMWCSDRCSFTSHYECNTLGFTCKVISRLPD